MVVGKRHEPVEFALEFGSEAAANVFADRIDELRHAAVEDGRHLIRLPLIDVQYLGHGVEPLIAACQHRAQQPAGFLHVVVDHAQELGERPAQIRVAVQRREQPVGGALIEVAGVFDELCVPIEAACQR